MRWLCAASVMLAYPASAEVVSSNENGFHIRHSVDLPVPPSQAFTKFGDIADWWDGNHTYSGSAANMRISLKPGGCLCETLPGAGGVEHMRVVLVVPDKQLVLSGSLGPLLYAATSGAMDVRFSEVPGGTRATMDYKVAGFASGGAAQLAPAVDQVLAIQMRRFAEAGTRPAVNR